MRCFTLVKCWASKKIYEKSLGLTVPVATEYLNLIKIEKGYNPDPAKEIKSILTFYDPGFYSITIYDIDYDLSVNE